MDPRKDGEKFDVASPEGCKGPGRVPGRLRSREREGDGEPLGLGARAPGRHPGGRFSKRMRGHPRGTRRVVSNY